MHQNSILPYFVTSFISTNRATYPFRIYFFHIVPSLFPRFTAIEPTLLRPILPIKVFGVGFMYGFLYHTAEEKLNFRNQIRVCGFCVIHMCKLLG